jgi:hypothetical protein
VIFDPPPAAANEGMPEISISPATIAHDGMRVKFDAVMHAMSEEPAQITPSELHADGTLIDGGAGL